MIIDMSEWLSAERKAPKEEGAQATEATPPPLQGPTEPGRVEMQTEGYRACPHRRMQINDTQRTVKCGDCGIWLDPVWCLRELFRYYETRVDHRLATIQQHEERAAAAEKRKQERRAKPRRAKAETMQQHLERAAFNEYQAKVLAARASAQRLAAGKIEAELEVGSGEVGGED